MNERKYSMSQVIWINLWFVVLLLLVAVGAAGYSQYRKVTLAQDREAVARLENVKLMEQLQIESAESRRLQEDVKVYDERFRGIEAENYQLRRQLKEAENDAIRDARL